MDRTDVTVTPAFPPGIAGSANYMTEGKN
jgi:hypothetical protein